jgi:hypothetical protein
MRRPSGSSIFVVAAVALAAGAFVMAKSAAGSEDAAPESGLPSDAARLGFIAAGPKVGDVVLLDATQPFRIELGHGPISGTPPGGPRLTLARAVVTRELTRYPSSFLRAIHLRGIVFSDELREGETSIPSLPNVGGLLLLDIDGTESDLVRGLHHEVFHFADLADDGSLSPDPEWEKLNAPGFFYGAGGRTLRSSWAAGLPADDGFLSGGFVSPYATSGPEEDKAETFAFAMSRPTRMRELVAHDPVLNLKLAEITRRIGKLDPEAPRVLPTL